MHVVYNVKNEEEILLSVNEVESGELPEQRQKRVMQHFSQVVSHYLRSPIVKIKSIMNYILDEDNIDDKSNIQNLLKNISNEANKLDEIIIDLNRMLAVFSKDEVKKYINFKRKYLEAYQFLVKEIEDSQAIIITDFSKMRGVFSVNNYVLYLMQKLISNAIKYRNIERQLIINIKSYDDGKYICLEFQDNGLGIDLNKYKSRVFGLYNRFHSHVKGKGTGLYLVKTETETLGGNIEIESNVDEGATFKIYFPKI